MSKKKAKRIPIINTTAAGIDIGSRCHVVAVAHELCDESDKTLQAFTSDLHNMADWLVEMGVTTVAMESTGVYWVAAYEMLEDRGLVVVLSNARDAKLLKASRTAYSLVFYAVHQDAHNEMR